jgi:flagellar biosynthesis GTPase FlhF
VQIRKPFSDHKKVFSKTENIGSSKMVRFRKTVRNVSNPKKKPTESRSNIAAASKEAVHDEPDDNSDEDSYNDNSESEDDPNQSDNASNSDDNDEDDEIQEDDEENDEASEDEAAFDATTAEWIQKRLDELNEKDIGNYTIPPNFAAVYQETQKIRKKHSSDDYLSIATDVQAWADSSDVMNVFSSFRGIIEFIIHVHRLYEVPLTATKDTENDLLLLETIENAIRKFNIRIHNS